MLFSLKLIFPKKSPTPYLFHPLPHLLIKFQKYFQLPAYSNPLLLDT